MTQFGRTLYDTLGPVWSMVTLVSAILLPVFSIFFLLLVLANGRAINELSASTLELKQSTIELLEFEEGNLEHLEGIKTTTREVNQTLGRISESLRTP